MSAATVTEALAAVMAELPNIGKADRSPEGYSYRGIEAVTRHVQPLFAKHGVVITPKAEITDVRSSPAMKDGWQDVYMRVEWTISGPGGTTLTAATTGIGRDRADKGANKAQTQAFKYLLLHMLCIADGKDETDSQTYEHDRREESPYVSADNAESLRAKCEAAGVAVAEVVKRGTDGRTEDPAEVFKREVAAVRSALDLAVQELLVAEAEAPNLVAGDES